MWAREACESEGELNAGPPEVSLRPVSLSGPFIEPTRDRNVHFPHSCQKRSSYNEITDHVSHVICKRPLCGRIYRPHSLFARPRKLMRRKRNVNSSKTETVKRINREERIVGGHRAEPMEWPFVVALYRNGRFLCGGTIYTERWVGLFKF